MNKINKLFKVIIIGLMVFLTGQILINPLIAVSLSGTEIMELVDENQFLESARMESKMEINDGRRVSEKEMVTYIKNDGEDTKANVEFINPRDRGARYLLLDNELWMYFPDAEDLVRISGHMLEQGMMGSDFSYQDALESEKLTDLYNFELIEEDILNNRPVYIIEGVAKDGEEVTYYKRIFFVDMERFVVLKEEMYAREGRLLKLRTVEEVEEIEDDRWIPTRMVMEDKIRQGTETIYDIREIDLSYNISEELFELESLQ